MSRSLRSMSRSRPATRRAREASPSVSAWGGQGDDLLAQGTHLDELAVELRQLFIELTTHYPNLPVM